VSTPAPRLRVVQPGPRPSLPSRLVALWTTPVQLWGLLGAVGLSALLLVLAIGTAMADSRQAFRTVGSDSVPSINYALETYFALSDMDADACNYLLLSEYPSPNLTRPEALRQYEQRRQTASDLLVSAAQNITYGDRERVPILRMTSEIQQFDADVARAELLMDQGNRAGALDEYQQATALMHDPRIGLLQSALDLSNANHDALTAGYDAARATEGRDVVLIVLAGLLLLASLVGLQLLLARRMRRALNLPALAATGVALALVIGAVATLAANDHQLEVAKQDAYDSVYALRLARATAFDANADESRYLLYLAADPQIAQRYQQAFLDKSLKLTTFPQAPPIDKYDAALAPVVAQVQRGQTPDLGGTFGTALHNITFAGEPPAAKAVMETWAAYQLGDRVLRRDATAGNMPEAVRFDTSAAPNDSDGLFNAFDAALGTWIQVNQDAFNQAVATGDGNLNGWNLYPAIGALLVVALTFVGLRPRIGEYR
jgi:hypothetical protein